MIRNIPVSSPELYAAYKAWRDQDVNDGDPELADLKRGEGLCFWTTKYLAPVDVDDELETQFDAAGLDEVYPFNHQGLNAVSYSYAQETRLRKAHLNPLRIQWVNDRIADYEKENNL